MALKPHRRGPKERKISTWDLEWVPANDQSRAQQCGFRPMQLRICGVFDDERGYRYYTSIADFIDREFVVRQSGRWFYAHAGGLFDIVYVFHYLLTEKPKNLHVDACMVGSAAVIVKITRGAHHWYLLDSFWLMRESLAKIGKWMGFEKLTAGGKDTFYAPLGELVDYNHRDCELLYRAIRHFEDVLIGLGGQLEKTVAASALRLFRMRYLREEISTSPALNIDARASYIASRVEVYQKDVEHCNYYDINSSFPYAMTSPAPGEYLRTVRRLPDHGLYLARVRVRVPESNVPPLPLRHPRDGRIYFPTGSWETWLNNVDVEYLQECGGSIESVKEVHLYDSFLALKHYAEHIYELRKNTDDAAYSQILKILLNSLYGKFAEGSRKSRLHVNPPKEFFSLPEAGPGETGRRLVIPGVWEYIEDQEIPHAHVPIASHITAIARRNLTRYMRQASDIYYCDTDGFAVPETDRFETSNQLGGLKFEKHMWRARFELPKLYAYQKREDGQEIAPDPSDDASWTLRNKGFSRIRGHWEGDEMVASDGEDSRAMRFSDFCKLLDGHDVLIDQFSRVKQGMLSGRTDPHQFLMRKRLRRKQRQKRRFLDDGSSRPWTVEELGIDGENRAFDRDSGDSDDVE